MSTNTWPPLVSCTTIVPPMFITDITPTPQTVIFHLVNTTTSRAVFFIYRVNSYIVQWNGIGLDLYTRVLYTPTYFHFFVTDLALITLEEVFIDNADWSAADATFLLGKSLLAHCFFRKRGGVPQSRRILAWEGV